MHKNIIYIVCFVFYSCVCFLSGWVFSNRTASANLDKQEQKYSARKQKFESSIANTTQDLQYTAGNMERTIESIGNDAEDIFRQLQKITGEE